ncbi:MAG TPA: alpha/beta fold hydrolase [Acidimicrobiales bacterium]|nr:alpha/beta fold hydrolase [Acidimicrobiales bacterium]
MADPRAPLELSYGPHRDQRIELFSPSTTHGHPPLALLIHGGYWRDRYGADLMHPMARDLASRGWKVANIEYRRLGESLTSGWPEIFEDIDSAAEAVAEMELNLGTEETPVTRRVVVIGHSAGGQLALYLARRGSVGHRFVDGVVALAPVADLVAAAHEKLSGGAATLLMGGTPEALPERYRLCSPALFAPLGRPQLLVHGTADVNVPISQTLSYRRVARDGGDRVELITDAPLTGPAADTEDGASGVRLTSLPFDHFDVIDPGAEVWEPIRDWLQNG